jgi:hypothetical protein
MPRNTATDKRYSVCIGINTYAPQAKLAPLSYAENDARDMDEMLEKLGFEPENRLLLLGEEATVENVNTALATTIFDRAKENDLVVFYYAGHGEPITFGDQAGKRQNEVFLTTYDFDEQKIKSTPSFRLQRALGMTRLRTTFFEGQEGSRKRLFIFDSCHSGYFYGSSYRDSSSQIQNSIKSMLDSNSVGRVFLASCLPYQTAVESSRYGHGIFTYHILQALSGEAPEARRSNGTVTVGSLFDYLADTLPSEQRPVRGGVEQDTFDLAYFPEFDGTTSKNLPDQDEAGKEERLKSMYTDQTDYVQDRLNRFVGRQIELSELRQRIDGKMERGGYVVITGEAGQGKSSIIAKLIAEQGLERSAYHFIQFGAGPGHQISILRNLMARLILKYHLPERYIAGESYPILRDYFRRVLKDIAEKGEREVIFIDGLDQLEADSSASHDIDISFLPYPLPTGIVIVVGTRPDKTQRAIERLANLRPDDSYFLRGLSREDFDRLLNARHVPLSAALSDSLYLHLKQNALYLDLVAQELGMQPNLRSGELIARLANNPDNIFTITFSRMQRLPGWYEVIRPILGVLLVAQEPLTSQQIAHIFHKENVRIREGIMHLGGLLTLAGQQRHSLFHPKLSEYLKQDTPDNDIQFDAEEVEKLHGRVAQWCEQGTIEQLWRDLPNPSPRDDYREYARRHYITHLHEAGKDEQLFTVLNDGQYERGKLRFDRSTRSTAADLKLGCQTAAREVASLTQGKELLNYLWRYTLLRTNLTTQADAYPLEAFQALLALGREREAFDLAELLTQPAQKLDVLILLTEYLLKQSAREEEGIRLYIRVYEIATSLEDRYTRTKALRDLTTALIHTKHLERARSVADILGDNDKQAKVLYEISDAYGKHDNWKLAKEVARSISMSDERVNALSSLAAKLKLSNEGVEAETLWQEASTIVSSLTDRNQHSRAMYHLSVSFTQAKEWERAETTARTIKSSIEKVSALCQLALFFTLEGLATRAAEVWEEAQAVVSDITDADVQDKALRVYAITQIQAGFQDEAEKIARRKISDPTEKIAVLSSLASHLVRKCLWEQSKRIIALIVREYDLTDVASSILDTILIDLSIDLARGNQWDQARETAHVIPRKEAQCRALMGIVSELARAELSEIAQIAWEEARAMCTAQMDAVQTSVTSILVSILVTVGRTEQAMKIIPTLPDKQTQEYIMEEIAVALARTGQIAEAEKIASKTTNPQWKANIQKSIAVTQIKAGQTELALAIARSIPNLERQSQVLGELVTTCCQMQQWDLAREIARQIQSSDLQASAISHILDGLVQVGKITETEKIARSIQNEFFKANVLCNLATLLARYDYTKDAERIAQSIRRNPRIRQKALSNIAMFSLFGASVAESAARAIDAGGEREEALCNVAIAYARENSWDEAERIANEINDEQKRDEAWGTIAIEHAKAGQWTPALTAFDQIQKSKHRIFVLQEWGTLLAQPAGQQTREQIVQHLSESKEKSSLLVSAAETLAQTGLYLEQIHLTQQAWLQASTKDDCQYLFAMVQRLLPRNSELCTDFYESFGWVDMLLNK